MSHPHDALLQAHLDGELEPPVMREVTRHLSLCDACREASADLARLAHEFGDAVREIDHFEPAEWSSAASAAREYAALALAAAAPGGVPAAAMPVAAGSAARPLRLALEQHARQPRRRARTPGSTSWRWAAAALLTVSSVAAAAVVRGPLLHRSDADATVDAPPFALSTALRPAGAIAVATPARADLELALSGAAAGSRLHITITDGAELSVNVLSDSASAEPARFATGDARIAVQLPETVSLVEVELPATLHSARILLGDAVVATAAAGRVTPAEAAVGGIALATPR